MNMETISTPHPLRTITLMYDRAKTSPAFESLALQYYHEIHERTWEILQRVQQGREPIRGFRLRIEEIEELFDQATHKFDHLKAMYPTNPVRDTVRGQLRTLLSSIDESLKKFVPELIDATKAFHDYDDYILEQEQWMDEVAFPQFHEIFANYEECSVDMVFFDLDLEDFRGALSYVKKLEGRYLNEMNALIDDYTGLNDRIFDLFGLVEDFDTGLL